MIPLWLSTGIPMPSFNWYAESGAHGGLPLSFTRATTATVTDFEGLIKSCLSGELRIQGARRVENLILKSSDASDLGALGLQSNSSATTTTVTFSAADAYRYKSSAASKVVAGRQYRASVVLSSTDKAQIGLLLIGIATNTPTPFPITLTGTPTRYTTGVWTAAAGDAAGNANMWLDLDNRVASGGDGTTTGTVTVADFQIEDVTGQSNQNPSEYVSVGVLSTPYHGYFVDGVKYFNTLNGNTVASNVVTEATGAAINSTTCKWAAAPGTGGSFSTPDSVAASITSIIDIDAEIAPVDWTISESTHIVGKWLGAGDQY